MCCSFSSAIFWATSAARSPPGRRPGASPKRGEERPSIVSFHFGLPREVWIRALSDAGIVLLASATNLREARTVATAGVQAIVAQGWEAGGHRGVFDPDASDHQMGTMALTRLFARARSARDRRRGNHGRRPHRGGAQARRIGRPARHSVRRDRLEPGRQGLSCGARRRRRQSHRRRKVNSRVGDGGGQCDGSY